MSRIIPNLLNNAFQLAIDPLFPPPINDPFPMTRKVFIPDVPIMTNRFELIFDELDHIHHINFKNKYDNIIYEEMEKEEEDCEESEDESAII